MFVEQPQHRLFLGLLINPQIDFSCLPVLTLQKIMLHEGELVSLRDLGAIEHAITSHTGGNYTFGQF